MTTGAGTDSVSRARTREADKMYGLARCSATRTKGQTSQSTARSGLRRTTKQHNHKTLPTGAPPRARIKLAQCPRASPRPTRDAGARRAARRRRHTRVGLDEARAPRDGPGLDAAPRGDASTTDRASAGLAHAARRENDGRRQHGPRPHFA